MTVAWPDPPTLAIIVAALGLGGLTKGLTGVGLPLVAIPMMASFWPVERAVAVLVLPGIVANGWLMWTHREAARGLPFLPVVIVTGLVGAVGGSWLLSALDNRILALVLAFWAGLYLINLGINPRFAISPNVARRLAIPVSLIGGITQGATGVSAPVYGTYLHAQRLPQKTYVFAITAIFQALAAAQLVALWQFGVFTAERLIEGTLALVPVLVCVPLGIRLGRRIGRALFDKLIIGLLIAMEARLLYIGLAG